MFPSEIYIEKILSCIDRQVADLDYKPHMDIMNDRVQSDEKRIQEYRILMQKGVNKISANITNVNNVRMLLLFQTVLYHRIKHVACDEVDGFKDFLDSITNKLKQIDLKFSTNPIALDILEFIKTYLSDSPIIYDLLHLLLKIVEELLI